MHISFCDTATVIPEPSLAAKVGVSGCIRWRQLSACQLTYDDNDAELVPVWVATKPRQAVIEVDEPEYKLGSRFVPVFN